MFTWACYYQILGPIFQSLVLLISIGNSDEDSGFYSFEALFTIFFTVGVAITWIVWVTNVRKLSPYQPNEEDIEGNEDDSTRSAHGSDGYIPQSSNKYISDGYIPSVMTKNLQELLPPSASLVSFHEC
jgi:hypothetical protein